MSRMWAGRTGPPKKRTSRGFKQRWMDYWLSVQRQVRAKQAWRGPDERTGDEQSGT